MYSRADRLFPATVEEVKRLQRTLRTRMPRFTLVPHGTHLARDVSEEEIRELRERWHIREGERIGLFVGEMSDRSNRRGLKWFSQAVRPQIGALPFHVRWVAVGATRPAGVVPPFEFVGYVDDLAAPLAAADLCIAPAFGEGTLPIKVLDYMGAGCPIVATPSAVQGLPIEKDHHLFVTQDPEEFARSVRVIILDPGLAYEFGKRSRDLVAAELTWEIIAEKLARDLARMLGMP
jgi:glycosyltransferase involved in cell wall biosynthesis